jgi:peptidoglycan hydrolase-like protein with peptidoglycan-binding domain
LPFPGRVVRLGDADAAVRAVQRRLNRVGCGPIDEDGVFGPQTAAAVRLFQARFPDVDGQPLKVDGIVGAITWGALFGGSAAGGRVKASTPLLSGAVQLAVSQIGVLEKPLGSNRGPEVDRYLRAAGLDPTRGSFPWCAAFVYFCFNEAAKALGRRNPVVRTAGVLDHWQRAGEKGVARITAASAHLHEALVRPGHVFVIDTGDPGGAGHTGLVEAVSAGKLVTIEGNTNDGGAREGIGVFRRTGRRIRDINVGFIDYGAA